MKQYQVTLIETSDYHLSSVYKLHEIIKEHLIKTAKGICTGLEQDKDNKSRLIFEIYTGLEFKTIVKEINLNIDLGHQIEMIDGIKPIQPSITAEITIEQVEIMNSYKDTFDSFVLDNLGNLYGSKGSELIEIKK
ncbi:MAG: hypothetical protein KAI99_18415 [Cyclobacteriaceae bacterium]|nr:hypothetical protein [Cyclobacteriaceae bacterium]